MHYSRKSFSVNGRDTITPKNGQSIGQRNGMSTSDIEELNNIYRLVVKRQGVIIIKNSFGTTDSFEVTTQIKFIRKLNKQCFELE